MAKFTPSIAKNQMRRALLAICDPLPSKAEVAKLWAHFAECCAYCGTQIRHGSRLGHLDHLYAFADGGTNSVFNFVLACSTCNGDEKRDSEWDAFLKNKTTTEPLIYAARKQTILAWHNNISVSKNSIDIQMQTRINEIIQKAVANFDATVSDLRNLKIQGHATA